METAGANHREPRNREMIEEIINSVTHGVGLVLSVVGLIILVLLACWRGGAWHIAGCAVYGVSLVALYAASTLYHAIRAPRWKHALHIADHAAIYLLIAGTYTPFTLINLRGGWGWSLFGAIWTLAAFGVAFKIFHIHRFRILSTLIYVLMGWMGVVAIKPMLQMIPSAGIAWLIAGGVFYTAGVFFFASKRIPYAHAIWHIFVIAGSVCHFFAVLYSVLPPAA